MRIEKQIQINAPASAVWAALEGRAGGDLHRLEEQAVQLGGVERLENAEVEVLPERRLELNLSQGGLNLRFLTTLEELTDGTRLGAVVDAKVPFLLRLLLPILSPILTRGLSGELGKIKAQAEDHGKVQTGGAPTLSSQANQPSARPTEPKDRQVIAKAREVIEYDRDPRRPGRPLHLLFGGGAIAAAALGLMIYVAYRGWYSNSIADNDAWLAIGLLFVVQVAGLFIFSYGYELYDVGKAIRLTAVLAFVAVAAIGVLIATLALLSKFDNSSSSTSSQRSQTDLGPLFSAVGSMIDDRLETAAKRQSAGSTGLEPEELTVFKITCPHCQARFTPTPPDAICPECSRSALATSPS